MIPYGFHKIIKEDIKSINNVLKSNFLTQGPKVEEFEKKINNYTRSKYAVVCNSASSALIMACKALDINKKHIVWTTSNSYVASANCALHCGASIDFVDIEISTGNISLKKLEEKLINAKKNNKLPKLLITVHFAGLPTQQEKIYVLSKKYNFKIIEDCSHSLGAKRNNIKIGNCKYSDISVFSFHPVKIITSGEGGACTTNDPKYYNKLKMLVTNGITKNINFMNKKNVSKFYYEQKYLGYNFKLSDIHCALGISQLTRVDKIVKKRNYLASLYKTKLEKIPVDIQNIEKNNYSSYHIFVIRIKPEYFVLNHKEIFDYFYSKKIFINMHYLPIHLHPFYKKLGFKKNMFPNAEHHAKTAITLPLYYDLNEDQIDKVIGLFSKIIK